MKNAIFSILISKSQKYNGTNEVGDRKTLPKSLQVLLYLEHWRFNDVS